MDILTLPAPVRSATPPVARPATITRGTTLALDLGTSTGWALQMADDFVTSGTLSLKHTRFDGGGMRFLRFRRWLEQLDIDAGPIEAVYFEEVRRHVGTDAAHIIGRSTAEPDQDYVAKIRRRAAAAILMLRTADSDAPGNVGPSPASWSMRSCAMM